MEVCPFKEGDALECRSFKEGYYGAWFRCKLEELSRRLSKQTRSNKDPEWSTWCKLQYTDFEDRPEYLKLYQFPPATRAVRAIMLRPPSPPILRPEDATWAHEGALFAVMNRDFEVGDYVEWRTGQDNEIIYWICQVVEVVSDKEVRVVCPSPPWGQSSDEVVSKSILRPALDWSPSVGWTVPVSKMRKPAVPLVSLVNAKAPVNAEMFKFPLATPFVEDWIDFTEGDGGSEGKVAETRCTVQQQKRVSLPEQHQYQHEQQQQLFLRQQQASSPQQKVSQHEQQQQLFLRQQEASFPQQQSSTHSGSDKQPTELPVCSERKLAVARRLVRRALRHIRLKLLRTYCHPRCIELEQKPVFQELPELEKLLELSETVSFCRDVLTHGLKESKKMRQKWEYVLFAVGDNKFVFQSMPPSPSEVMRNLRKDSRI